MESFIVLTNEDGDPTTFIKTEDIQEGIEIEYMRREDKTNLVEFKKK